MNRHLKTFKELTYLHNNYQNSPVVTTNELGQILQNNYYDIWGSGIATSTATTTIQSREGYTGHITDEETGNIYAHARYLNPTNKVWTQQDPMMWDSYNSREFLENPQVQNSYSYAVNNPTSYTDPDGRTPAHLAVLLIGTGVGAAVSVVAQGADDLGRGEFSGISEYASSALSGGAIGFTGTIATITGAGPIAVGATMAGTSLSTSALTNTLKNQKAITQQDVGLAVTTGITGPLGSKTLGIVSNTAKNVGATSIYNVVKTKVSGPVAKITSPKIVTGVRTQVALKQEIVSSTLSKFSEKYITQTINSMTTTITGILR